MQSTARASSKTAQSQSRARALDELPGRFVEAV
jgi:hypothetical protein